MVFTWAVTAVLDDETTHGAVVLAVSAGDAGVVLGNKLRADAGLPPDGVLGIVSMDIRRLDDSFRGMAINRHPATAESPE